MKKSPIIVTFLLVALAIPTFALAQPGQGPGPKDRPGYGWHHPGVAPEKAEAYGKIMDEHYAKAYPLGQEMRMKRMELEYMSRLERTEPKDITKLLNDMRGLEQQMDKMREATAERLQKEIGLDARDARLGMHFGHRGAGFGPGGCPGWDRDGGKYGCGGDWDGPRGDGPRHHRGR